MENTTNENKSFVCLKCGNTTYASGKTQTVARTINKIFNQESSMKFITVSCLKCGYTELYKTGTAI